MTTKEKLEQFDLFDQSIIRHGSLDNVRDYEIIGYLCGIDSDTEVQYVFKGCIQADYKIKLVDPKHFSMDDRLLDISRQDEPDYPKVFIWGAGATVYPGWTLTQDTNELKQLEKNYGVSFSKISIDTNAYNLTLVFHDIETKVLRQIDKKINAL